MGWLHPRYDHVGEILTVSTLALAIGAAWSAISARRHWPAWRWRFRSNETIVTKIISIMAVAFALAAGSITVMTVQHRFIATYENRQSWIEPACGPVQSLPSVTP